MKRLKAIWYLLTSNCYLVAAQRELTDPIKVFISMHNGNILKVTEEIRQDILNDMEASEGVEAVKNLLSEDRGSSNTFNDPGK